MSKRRNKAQDKASRLAREKERNRQKEQAEQDYVGIVEKHLSEENNNQKEVNEMAKQGWDIPEDEEKDRENTGMVGENEELPKVPEMPDEDGEIKKDDSKKENSDEDSKKDEDESKKNDDESKKNEDGNKNNKSKTLSDSPVDDIEGIENIVEVSDRVSEVLRRTVRIKQFITKKGYGRSLAYTMKENKSTNSYTATAKVELIKPGKAETVVINVPRKLQSILKKQIASIKDSSVNAYTVNSTLDTVLYGKNGELLLTDEELKDTVDVVVKYTELLVFIDGVLGGVIAEYKDDKDLLATDVCNVKYTFEKNSASMKASETKLPETALIGSEDVVFYTLGKKYVEITKKLANHYANPDIYEYELSDSEKKVLNRFSTGKMPLIRIAGAFSSLYNDKNFTSVYKFATETPFADNYNSETVGEQLSSRAYKAVNKGNVNFQKIFDVEMFAKNESGQIPKVAHVFDSAYPAKDRFNNLTVNVSEDENKKVVKKLIKTCLVRDYYSGNVIDEKDMAKVEFVKYTIPEDTGKRIYPKAMKYVPLLSNEEENISRGIIGTVKHTDKAYSNLLNVTDETTAKNALKSALYGESNQTSTIDVNTAGKNAAVRSYASKKKKDAAKQKSQENK